MTSSVVVSSCSTSFSFSSGVLFRVSSVVVSSVVACSSLSVTSSEMASSSWVISVSCVVSSVTSSVVGSSGLVSFCLLISGPVMQLVKISVQAARSGKNFFINGVLIFENHVAAIWANSD